MRWEHASLQVEILQLQEQGEAFSHLLPCQIVTLRMSVWGEGRTGVNFPCGNVSERPLAGRQPLGKLTEAWGFRQTSGPSPCTGVPQTGRAALCSLPVPGKGSGKQFKLFFTRQC